MTHSSDSITDARPYVVVRWLHQDARVPVLIDPKRGLYIPREFEAGIVTSDVRVNFKLQATEALRDLYDIAGHEPPELEGPVLVKSVTITSGWETSLSADRFRRVKFKTYVRLAAAAAAGTRDELRRQQDEEFVGGSGTMDEWREKKIFFADVARHPVGRPSLEQSDCFYYFERLVCWQEVVDVAAQGGAKPIKALMDHFSISRSTARRWRDTARQPAPARSAAMSS